MLFYCACAITSFAASWLFALWTRSGLHAIWITPLSAMAGVMVSTTLFTLILPLIGQQLDKAAFPTIAARAFLYSIVAAAVAVWIVRSRQGAKSDGAKKFAHGGYLSLACFGLLGLASLGLSGQGIIRNRNVATDDFNPERAVPLSSYERSQAFDPSTARLITAPPVQPVPQQTADDFNPARAVPISSYNNSRPFDPSTARPVAAPPTPQQNTTPTSASSQAALDIERARLDRSHPGWRNTVSSPGFNAWLRALPADYYQQYVRAETASEFGIFLDAYSRNR